MGNSRKCPYCGAELDKPYWRHIQSIHPKEFEGSMATWKQLYLDYTGMGMSDAISILAICELFNKSEDVVREYLTHEKVLK